MSAPPIVDAGSRTAALSEEFITEDSETQEESIERPSTLTDSNYAVVENLEEPSEQVSEAPPQYTIEVSTAGQSRKRKRPDDDESGNKSFVESMVELYINVRKGGVKRLSVVLQEEEQLRMLSTQEQRTYIQTLMDNIVSDENTLKGYERVLYHNNCTN